MGSKGLSHRDERRLVEADRIGGLAVKAAMLSMLSFNEAAASHRGKPDKRAKRAEKRIASMRPRHHTAENTQKRPCLTVNKMLQ